MPILVPILGDQLSHDLASLTAVDRANTVVLIVEVDAETRYVRHHKKKIAFLFAAMRHFAAELAATGWRVDYVRLGDAANTHSFDGEISRAAARHNASQIVTVEAGEHRVLAMQQGWSALTGLPCDILADDRFYCTRDDFAAWAAPRKRLVMEDFYREMRVRTGLLMDGGRPAGDRWNYDADNRQKPPPGLDYPPPPAFAPDAATGDVLTLVETRFAGHFGDLLPFTLGVTRANALAALDHFIAHALPRFGDYQDAMVEGEDWLFHGWLSPYLNAGLLCPREVCAAADAAWRDGDVPLNCAEGFIRQILGWREYVRGVYWLEGPGYTRENALQATRDLPEFYWTGDTANALPGAGNRRDQAQCLCPSHPAADGARQLRYAGWCPSASGP